MDVVRASKLLAEHGHDGRYLDDGARHAFLQACVKGPLELVEAFLVSGMPIHATADHVPPIIKAAESGMLAHLQLLLRYGASLATVDRTGDTAIHTAANHSHADLVLALHREYGSSLDTINTKKWTPLTWAVHKKHGAIVDAVLACEASPDFGAPPPLVIANDDAAMVRMLLRAGAKPDVVRGGDTLLLAFARLGNLELVRLLLEHGARDLPNRAGWTAWMVANDPATATSPDAKAIAALLERHGESSADTRLHQACREGAVERARQLVQDGANLDAVDASGRTALHAACATKQRDDALVRWLLDRGANPAIPSLAGEAPITHLAGGGHVELCELLLARGATANESVYGTPEAPVCSNALLWAANAGHLEVVRVLAGAGARLDSRDRFEQTPVFLAASKGRDAVLAELLARGADPSAGGREGMSPLIIAISSARTTCVEALVAAGAALEVRDFMQKTPLMLACDQWRSKNAAFGEIVRLLLEGGADAGACNSSGWPALKIARSAQNEFAIAALDAFLVTAFLERHTRDGGVDWPAAAAAATTEHLRAFVLREDLATIGALLDHGLAIALVTTGPTPVLFEALRLPSPALATLLLDRGADPRCVRRDNTTLLLAAGSGHTGLVERLLALGLDPNLVVGNYKDCALARAARGGHVETVTALLAAGANPNPFRGGITPLIAAALGGQAAVASLLLAHGADPDIVNSQRETALEVARKKSFADVVEVLAARAKPDARDARGRTPLLRACIKGDLAIIDAMLRAKADPNAADATGVTPRDAGALRADVAARLRIAHVPLVIEPIDQSNDPFGALRRGTSATELDVAARDHRGDTALHVAIVLDSGDLVAALLDRGADVHARNAVGDTPWSLAINVAPSLEPVLCARGARIDIAAQIGTGDRRVAFDEAMNAGDLAAVDRQLGELAVSPHLTTAHRSPLSTAVRLGDLALVQLLLAKGSDPHVRLRGATLLAQASAQGNAAIVGALLDAGVPAEAAALQVAAHHGRRAAVVRLLDAGLSPRAIDVTTLDDAEATRVLLSVAHQRSLEELVAACDQRLRVLLGPG